MIEIKKNITTIAIALVVLGVLVVGGAVSSVQAEGSFWAGVQKFLAIELKGDIMANAPDFSIEDLVVGGTNPDIYTDLRVRGNFTWGANLNATTTVSTTETIAGSDLLTYGYWDIMSNVGNLTYTLPATSTMMDLLPKIGSSRTWLIHNASSTPTLTIAAGAGMDIVGVAGAEVIDGTEWAELTCTQIYYRAATNENIICIMTELER